MKRSEGGNMAKKVGKKKKKKATRKSAPKIRETYCSYFNKMVDAIEKDGETYVKLEDIILDYATQYSRNQYYNENFILKTLSSFTDTTETDFWENKEYESIQNFFISKAKEYQSYHVAYSLIALLESKREDEYKIKSIKRLDTMPGILFNYILDNDVHEDIKVYVMDKYKVPSDIAINIVLGGESKRLASLAIRHLDIDDVDCPDLLATVACSNINRDKRVKAIEKICNTDVLKKIVFESDDFEIIKKARTRIKELPNALRFIVDDKPTYKVA